MSAIVRCVWGSVLPICFAVVGIWALSLSGAAAEVSEEARQACTGDAMRLCSDFIPDVQQVTACMMRKRAQVSPGCRLAMAHEHMRYRRAGRGTCRYQHCR
jgi:hypothetical protein